MSYWTHIQAVILVNSNKSLELIKKIMEKAPKITGSEENAFVFINHIPRITSVTYSNGDCCECQDDICISLIGDLRDAYIYNTKKEYRKFMSFLRHHFVVLSYTFSISDDFKKIVKKVE